jgi:bifunctional DNA-binding transcriptional regulator/antitoxin component of YhaV-PrlF toxin-antitoxin module
MDTIRIVTTIEEDGEIRLSNLPLKRGQRVELVVRSEGEPAVPPPLTADRLLATTLIGLWADREDLGESSTFARQLRDEAQRRNRGSDAPA